MTLKTLLVSLVGIAIAAPALAGNIYSWRTPTGDVAFTDDIKNVPTRYRDRVETRQTGSLADYARFSAQPAEEADNYASRLNARLEYLQGLNGPATQSDNSQPTTVGTASINIGGVLTLNRDGDRGPVIVERVRVIGEGQIATRHDTVVRQGDRTLAIMRGNQEGETGAVSNVVAEKDVERYR